MRKTSITELEEISNEYKYSIWRLWQNLTRAEQTKAKALLPNLLGVSIHTFKCWMYYKKNEYHSIPADQLYQLATFFGVKIEDMWTETPASLHLDFTRMKNELKTA